MNSISGDSDAVVTSPAAPFVRSNHSPVSGNRIDSLDALRGVAILAVIIVHCGLDFPSMDWIWYRLAWGGRYGVDLFFAVSGFVLCHTYHRIQARSHQPRRLFLIRRWARLAPVYYLGIVIYGLLMSPPRFGQLDRVSALANLTFLNGWIPNQANLVVPGGWSISTEAAFGIVFICLVPWLSTARSTAYLCILSWLVTYATTDAVGSALATLFKQDAFGRELEYLPWPYLPTFLGGVWCWHIWNKQTVESRLPHWTIRGAFGVVGIALFLAIPLEFLPGNYRTLIVGPASALLLFAWMGGPLSGRWTWPLSWLGRLSYGIYMMHFALLNVASVFAIGLLPIETPSFVLCASTVIATLILTVPLAWVSWVCIEQPVHLWINRKSV